MAIRNIVKKEDPILGKKSRPVTEFNDRLRTLAADMIETMHAANGVGLAGPQVGILRRIVVVEPEQDQPIVMVNPVITKAKGSVEGTEGCLSVPNVWGIVKRPASLTVTYQDVDGVTHEERMKDFAARVVCHETDHLEGILFTEKAERFVDPEEDAEE